ncbi:hypothetical protein [Bacillus massiliglaciei]|uniref:hypothetical protein n=1 Tax=Bacillus massiliglaciei TaxID=1816693 RepID=UPI0018FEB816|nr:hypothetical protein [Bacillus massiliglaciei]
MMINKNHSAINTANVKLLKTASAQDMLERLLKETENSQVRHEQIKEEIEKVSGKLDALQDHNRSSHNEQLLQKIEKLSEEKREQENLIETLKRQLAAEIQAHNESKEKMLQMLNEEKQLLLAHKKLKLRYDAISHSKLGKITLFYWKKMRLFRKGQ